MRILTNYQDTLEFLKPYIQNSKPNSNSNSNSKSSGKNLPSQINGPWHEDQEAAENTLKYIFEKLHHNCYMLCSTGTEYEIVKLESATTAPTLKPFLEKKLNKTIKGTKRKSLLKTLRKKEWRIMQCIVKPFKSSSDNLFPRFLESLQTKIPKGIFILSLNDSQILREDGTEPWQMITGSKDLGLYKFNKYLPLLAYSGQEKYWDIPIPTYDDIEYIERPILIDNLEWDQKINKAVFRGNPTGCGYTTNTNMRLKISTMKSSILDAGIIENISHTMKFDPIEGLGELNQPSIKKVQRLDLFKDQIKYKYIVHIDGNVLAYRLLKSMLLGSLILRVRSPYVHWLDHIMEEGKHFIYIKEDLSDLEQRIQWCIENDLKAKKIALQGQKLAQKVLTKEFIGKYFLRLLKAL